MSSTLLNVLLCNVFNVLFHAPHHVLEPGSQKLIWEGNTKSAIHMNEVFSFAMNVVLNGLVVEVWNNMSCGTKNIPMKITKLAIFANNVTKFALITMLWNSIGMF